MKRMLLVLTLFVYGCGNQQSPLPSMSPTPLQSVVPTAPVIPITMGVVGDIANCSSALNVKYGRRGDEYVSDVIARIALQYLILPGDTQYPTGAYNQYGNCFDQTFGRFMNFTFPAPGNHEYLTPDAIGYKQYFREKGRIGATTYYAKNLDPYWHLIVLDSNISQDAGQLTFVQNDLQTNTRPCIISVWHYPIHSSGVANNNVEMLPILRLLYQMHVTLVLEAHDHSYEPFYPQDPDGNPDPFNGYYEFVVGTGGGELQKSISSMKPNSRLFRQDIFGVLKLTLRGMAFDYEFLSAVVPTLGTLSDIGSGTCRPDPAGSSNALTNKKGTHR